MKKTQAILTTLFTVLIAVVGFSGYSDGSHYISYFGIRLSQGAFMVLVAVFVAIDVFALKSAFSKDKAAEELQSKAQAKAHDAPLLEGAPCAVSLTRLPSAIGAAVGIRVFLNGEEQELLKNGKTIRMQTNLAENELMVRYNADSMTRTVAFGAKPGGQVRITLKYTGGVLAVQDDVADAPASAADEKGRYRPVKTGYVVWSILNMPLYFMGIIPLRKTLRAAKEPYEDVASHLLKSARAWNIGLSCFLIMVIMLYKVVLKNIV